MTTSYTQVQQATVDTLYEMIENMGTKMAVVDYLGRISTDDEGYAFKVTEDTESGLRFGIRSKQHVEVYGLTVVRRNKKWEAE